MGPPKAQRQAQKCPSNAQAKGLTFFLTGERPLQQQRPTEGARLVGCEGNAARLNLSGKADSEGTRCRSITDDGGGDRIAICP